MKKILLSLICLSVISAGAYGQAAKKSPVKKKPVATTPVPPPPVPVGDPGAVAPPVPVPPPISKVPPPPVNPNHLPPPQPVPVPPPVSQPVPVPLTYAEIQKQERARVEAEVRANKAKNKKGKGAAAKEGIVVPVPPPLPVPAVVNGLVQTPPAQTAVPKAIDPNAGKFVFDAETHDFGNIPEGPVAEYDFVFENQGRKPIIIKEAHGSCGCTVPSYPKEPIAPGRKGTIHVTFSSANRPGAFNKDVIITSDAQQETMVLKISGNVTGKQ